MENPTYLSYLILSHLYSMDVTSDFYRRIRLQRIDQGAINPAISTRHPCFKISPFSTDYRKNLQIEPCLGSSSSA